jgi:hypothetical protein
MTSGTANTEIGLQNFSISMRLTEVQFVKGRGTEQDFGAVDTSGVDDGSVASFDGGTVATPPDPTVIIGAVAAYANSGLPDAAGVSVVASQFDAFQS